MSQKGKEGAGTGEEKWRRQARAAGTCRGQQELQVTASGSTLKVVAIQLNLFFPTQPVGKTEDQFFVGVATRVQHSHRHWEH